MGSSVLFGLLGPVGASIGGRAVPLGGPRARAVLATLLLSPNRVVPLDSLVSSAWGDEPPDSARFQAQNRMSALRRALREAGSGDLIDTAGAGYLLAVKPGELDVHRFEEGVADARRRVDEGDLDKAAGAITGALAIWRGPALHGLDTPRLLAAARQMDEDRLAAQEMLFDIELRSGRHQEIVSAILDHSSAHPWRERPVAQLMLALYRSHRRRDALEAFERTSRLLATELGLDPGHELVRLRDQILRDDPSLSVPSAGTAEPAGRDVVEGPPVTSEPPGATLEPPTARMLPRAVPDFVGRDHDLAVLTAAVWEPTRATVYTVAGPPGVGKTALAVHWAHQVADRFPEGQLYVNLHGFDPAGAVMTPGEAVRGFLEVLGVPSGRIPPSLDAQAALYRSMLAGKRMLVVLDNARDAEQVRPLLPGTPTALAVVTSRNQLTGLVAADGACPLTLDILSTMEARELLVRRLGSERVTAEPQAVEQIVTACARLPLALSIAAARAQQTSFPLTTIAAELGQASERLGALDAGDTTTEMRAVFSWSYTTLPPPAARLFRLLGLHPGPDISTAATASLTGHPVPVARRLLTELTRANLLVEHVPGRYTFHDLLRAYAGDLTHTHDPDDTRYAAATRLLDHYTLTAHTANRLIYPTRDPIPLPLSPPTPDVTPEHPTDYREAMVWLTTEHPVLLATLRQAAGSGFDTHTWQLAWTLHSYLDGQGHWDDLTTAWRAALHAASRLGDPAALAVAHRSIARAHTLLGRYADAHAHLRHAIDLHTRAGDRVGQAHTHHNLAILWERQGHLDEALDHARKALTHYRSARHLRGQADALNAVGWYLAQLGDHTQALASCGQALTLYRRLGDRHGEAFTWDSLGYAHHHAGHRSRAADCYQHATDLLRDLGERCEEAITLTSLGDTHHAAGNPIAARTAWTHALHILTALDHPDVQHVRTKLHDLDQPVGTAPGLVDS